MVDIRAPSSFAQGHINKATRVDNQNIASFIEQADPATPLVVYCYHGKSSQQVAQLFRQHGLSQAYSMEGGFTQWALSQPVVNGAI